MLQSISKKSSASAVWVISRRYTVNNATAAFSLLEMSILLIVLSIIVVGSFSFLAIDSNRKNAEITNEKLNTIEEALTIYLAVNGNLPCPASPWQSRTNATFGQEKRQNSGGNVDSCISSSVTSIMSSSLDNDIQYLGAVPVRALGLADDYMFDGWGRRFGYAVQKIFINNSNTNTLCVSNGKTATVDHYPTDFLCFKGQASGSTNTSVQNIRIMDNYNGNVLSYDAVYVLVSYGQNGYGGFLNYANVDVDGGATSSPQAYRSAAPPSSNTNELVNAGYDPSGSWSTSALVSQYISAPPRQNFDDIVRFKTRNALVLECNLYANKICKDTHGIFMR